jgi:hypothetical protein
MLQPLKIMPVRSAMRKFFTWPISMKHFGNHYGKLQIHRFGFTEYRNQQNLFFGNPVSTTLHLQTVSRDPKGHQPSTNPATVVK